MKKIIKILLSVFVPVVCALSLTLGLVFGLNKPNTIAPTEEAQEEVTPYKGKLVGGIYYASANEETGASEAPKTSKGAIYVADGAEVTINSGLISGHEALYGGAIYVENGGILYVNGGTFTGNTSRLGGAIYVENGGTVEFTGGTFTGNYSEYLGNDAIDASNHTAVIYAEYGATVTTPENCTISNNISQYYGNYVVYNVDGSDTYVSTGYEVSEQFDLNTAPLDYEHCCGYFSDATFMTGVEEGADYANVQQYTTNTGKTFTKSFSGLYTKTATPEKLAFTLSTDTYSVSDSNYVLGGSVVIPRQYEGKDVTGIRDSSFYGNAFASITISSSVTSIGDNAFKSCTYLTSIIIPNNVTSVGSEAFYNCTRLTSVVIGSGVTTVCFCTFSDCTSLISVTLGSNVTTIDNQAFYRCRALTSIIIPASVTDIGSDAFSGCTNLFEVCNLSSLNVIAGRSDYGLVAKHAYFVTDDPIELEGSQVQSNNVNYHVSGKGTYKTALGLVDGSVGSLVIDNNCTAIKEGAFDDTNLINVTLGNNVAIIGSGAFQFCYNLASITIPDSVEIIGDVAFDYCTHLTNISIPSSVISIENGAFQYCSGLTSVTIGSGVTSIGQGAFDGCNAVTTANVPYSAISDGGLPTAQLVNLTISSGAIPSNVFYNNTNLQSLTLGAGVTSIDDNAFSSCSGLASVIINSEVTGWYTFSVCTSLTSATIGNNVTFIDAGLFLGCSSLTSITIPNNVTKIDGMAFSGCTGLTEINYNGNLSEWELSSIDHHIFANAGANTAGITLTIGNQVSVVPAHLFYDPTDAPNITSVIIGNNVTKIGTSAFNRCLNLTNVTMGTSLQTIGNSAFSGCSALTSVSIPSTVTSIGQNAFRNCTGLTNITVPSGVTSIGTDAFYGCANIVTADVPYSAISSGTLSTANLATLRINSGALPQNAFTGASFTSLTIGSGVSEIGQEAFGLCSDLATLTIESGVTTIGNWAFAYCDSLTSVTIPNSVTTMGDAVFAYCDSLTSVKLPSTLTSVGNVIFGDCPNIITVDIPYSMIGMFDVSNITTLTISSGEISAYAFVENNSIETLTIGADVTSIGEGAFTDADALTSVTFAEGYTQALPSSIFVRCDSLTTVTLASTMNQFALKAFNGSNALTTISWKDKLMVYAPMGFDAALAGICPGVIFIMDGYDTSVLTGLYVYVDGYGWLSLAVIAQTGAFVPYVYSATEQATGHYWHYVDNVPTTWTMEVVVSGTTVTGYIGNGGPLTIPNGVTAIGDNAFVNCAGLSSITIPSSVTSIGEDAFANCTGITSITLPNGLTTIGAGAFFNTRLETVTIPSSVTSIGERAFENCVNLVSASFDEGCAIDLVPNIFKGCISFTTITIASTMDTVCNNTFKNCSAFTTLIWRDKAIVYSPGGFDTFAGYVFLQGNYDATLLTQLNITVYDGDAHATYTLAQIIGAYNNFEVYKYSENQPTTASGVHGWWHYVSGVPTIW